MARSPAGPETPLSQVEALLKSLRRNQRHLVRHPRAAVEAALENAVRQLLSKPARTRPLHVSTPPTPERTYRVDDLARVSKTTVRNIRAYQERGLLHPPQKSGRISLFDDTHVARLKIINSMLERGYASGHIKEMLSAWESGNDIAHVLGVESALITPAGNDVPQTLPLSAAREMAGGEADLDQYVAAGLAEMRGTRVKLLRPHLMAAFMEMRGYGMTTSQLLDVHLAVVPAVDQVTHVLVNAGAEHLAHMFELGNAPSTTDLTDLVGMLQRFRALAMSSVSATVSDSLDRTIESLLAAYLAQFVDKTSQVS